MTGRRFSLILWGACFIACLPFLWQHVTRLWNFEQYHYLPALVLATALLIYNRWNRGWSLPGGKLSWSLFVAGGLCLLLAILAASGWMGTAALVLFFGAWTAAHVDTDGRSLRSLWPVSWLLLSIPLGFDESLTTWLQLQSSRLSSFAMDAVGIPHVQFGNVIELVAGKLFVEQACSGVQSLFTLLFVAVLIVVSLRRSSWLFPLYLAAAIVWAVVMNVVRIFTIAYAQHFYQTDLAHGVPHAILGYVCLAGAVLLLLSTDRLMRVWFFPIDMKEAGVEVNPWVFTWNRLFHRNSSKLRNKASTEEAGRPGWVSYASLSFAAVAAIASWGQFSSTLLASGRNGPAKSVGQPFLKLPEQLADLGLQGFDQNSHEQVRGDIDLPFGENADVWRGAYDGLPVTIAVNQPYPDWHDLCICYQGMGLQLNDRQTVATADGTSNTVQARFVSPTGEVTYLWFSALDNAGQPVPAPAENVIDRWLTRFKSSDSLLSSTPQGDEVAIVQVVVGSDQFLLPEAVVSLTNLHRQLQELIQAQASSLNDQGSEARNE